MAATDVSYSYPSITSTPLCYSSSAASFSVPSIHDTPRTPSPNMDSMRTRRHAIKIEKDDHKVILNKREGCATEVVTDSYDKDLFSSGSTLVRDKQEGDQITQQVMDNFDTLFDVLGEAFMRDTDKVKIVLAKKSNEQLRVRIKGVPTREQTVDMILKRPESEERQFLRHNISLLNQEIKTLQTEVCELREKSAHRVVVGSTPVGSTTWIVFQHKTFKNVLATAVDLSPYNFEKPPTTIIAQLHEFRNGRVVTSSHKCAVENVTNASFMVRVKSWRGRMRSAKRKNWHIYFVIAF